MCVRRTRNARWRDEPPEFSLEEAVNFALANEREGGRELWGMTRDLAETYADEYRYPYEDFIAELRRQGIEVIESKRKRNQELSAPELDYEYGEWVPVEAVMFNDDGSVSLLNAETDMEVIGNPEESYDEWELREEIRADVWEPGSGGNWSSERTARVPRGARLFGPVAYGDKEAIFQLKSGTYIGVRNDMEYLVKKLNRGRRRNSDEDIETVRIKGWDAEVYKTASYHDAYTKAKDYFGTDIFQGDDGLYWVPVDSGSEKVLARGFPRANPIANAGAVTQRDVGYAAAAYQRLNELYGENNMATQRAYMKYVELRDAYEAKHPKARERRMSILR